jgi:glycerol kinase
MFMSVKELSYEADVYEIFHIGEKVLPEVGDIVSKPNDHFDDVG